VSKCGHCVGIKLRVNSSDRGYRGNKTYRGVRARDVQMKIAIVRPSFLHRFFAMSSNDVFSKLSSPIRDLIIGSSQQDQQQLGISDKDQAEVAQWVEKAAQPDFVKSDAFLVCVLRS